MTVLMKTCKRKGFSDPMNLHLFFHGEHGVVRSLFNKRISRQQVRGCELIIDAFEHYQPDGTLPQLAYILATAYHETAYRMWPVRETLASSDQQAINRLESAWRRGRLEWVKTPYWREGYFGRGFVQLTHRANYEGPLREAVLDVFPDKDIAVHPEYVLDPEVSAYILIEGMMRGDTGLGDFTSSCLEDYVRPGKKDYYTARRVVNPGDRPSYNKIASEAELFEAALTWADWADFDDDLID